MTVNTTYPEAAARLARDYNVSRETMQRLATYHALLLERAPTLSLVGRATLEDAWDRHFRDSAQLFPLVQGQGPVLDIGTGAGFPGMVLAIMGIAPMHLADNNQQKIAFLQDVAAATGTDVTIHNVKAEALPDIEAGIVTSRALAPLADLLVLGSRFFARGATGLFPKGRKAPEEIDEARKRWHFTLETFPSATADESSILRLSAIRPIK
jgi:16S rRNA (guanine527-N7)-methyltransferase